MVGLRRTIIRFNANNSCFPRVKRTVNVDSLFFLASLINNIFIKVLMIH